MNNYKVKIIYHEDFDAPGQLITEYIITAKEKLQAINLVSKKAKSEITDYSNIRHNLFYDVMML